MPGEPTDPKFFYAPLCDHCGEPVNRVEMQVPMNGGRQIRFEPKSLSIKSGGQPIPCPQCHRPTRIRPETIWQRLEPNERLSKTPPGPS